MDTFKKHEVYENVPLEECWGIAEWSWRIQAKATRRRRRVAAG